MGRKLGLTSLFLTTWPSCSHPRTSSFRDDADVIFKTVNSVFFDSADSFFTNSSSESDSFISTASDSDDHILGGEAAEAVIRGLRSDRLFFEPGDTSSILPGDGDYLPFKQSTAMAMESENPYKDFLTSMEEMVAAHGLKEWEGLEELLVWYLKVNGKSNHGFIVGAFVDLVVGLSGEGSLSPPTTTASSSSSSVFYEIEELKDEGSGSSQQ